MNLLVLPGLWTLFFLCPALLTPAPPIQYHPGAIIIRILLVPELSWALGGPEVTKVDESTIPGCAAVWTWGW